MSFGPRGMVMGGGQLGCGGVSMAGRQDGSDGTGWAVQDIWCVGSAAETPRAMLVEGGAAAARTGVVLSSNRVPMAM